MTKKLKIGNLDKETVIVGSSGSGMGAAFLAGMSREKLVELGKVYEYPIDNEEPLNDLLIWQKW